MVSDELLALLVCPLGKAALRREGELLVCTRCGPSFAIRDAIPNMIIEEAQLPQDCPTMNDLACVRAGDAKVEMG